MRANREARARLGIASSRLSWYDLLRESSLSVMRHPGRSLMTAVGTVLGAAAFVATLGVSSTIQHLVSGSFDVRRATEVRVVAGSERGPDAQKTDGEQDGAPGWQSRERLDRLRSLNGVVAAGKRLGIGDRPVAKVMGGTSRRLKVLGADPGAVAVMRPHIVLGRAYDGFHETRGVAAALLPATVARDLGVDRVGVAIFVADRPFLVMGIFDDVARRPEALLDVIIPANTAEKILEGRTDAERDVLIATAPGAAQLIGDQAPSALWPEDPATLRAIAPPDPHTLRREVEGSVQRSTLLLSVIALVIGAVSIANAATASVSSRIPEIGLRRAVGGRPIHVFAQLFGETTVLGLLGGVVGVLAGLLVTGVVALVNGWTPVLDARTALLAAVACAGSGMLAGLWPAARATRIAPVAALQR